MKSPIELLLQILDEAYEKKTWHGPNLKGSLRGVAAKNAAWRPGKGRHNIWELAVHAAYWKYAARRRLSSGSRKTFPVRGSNWFERPAGRPAEKSWSADRALLDEEHRKLRDAVSHLPVGGSHRIPAELIFGVAFHDVYHAGQVQLLKRLLRAKKRT